VESRMGVGRHSHFGATGDIPPDVPDQEQCPTLGRIVSKHTFAASQCSNHAGIEKTAERRRLMPGQVNEVQRPRILLSSSIRGCAPDFEDEINFPPRNLS